MLDTDDLRALIDAARADEHKPGVRALIRRIEAEANELEPGVELVAVPSEHAPAHRLCSPIEALRILLPWLEAAPLGRHLIGPPPYGYPTLVGVVRGALEHDRLAMEARTASEASEDTPPAPGPPTTLRDVSASESPEGPAQ